ncbi:PREDICTED: ankyrin repeat domain-containing protein 23 isoform X2 [Atta colombica]|uniref:ankyrin repeat domain-containing protein 23 isoform X2 n=1 Tax=Atta colombica TaxID=520822 RepID=UPI00084CBC94|nr:PREDICTED: ankyrin repeat domain-containing protein 23 isoform X2 [Atta colombica]
MDDVADSRGREAMLPDSGISGSVACCNVNMTSIDSGVETGNDSNDSSIVQQEGQQQQVVASQVISNGVTAVDTNSIGEFPNLDMYDWPALIHPLFVPDESRRTSPEVTVMLQKNRLLKINAETLEIIRNKHKISELSTPSDLYRPKIRVRVLRTWRKNTNTQAVAWNDWQTERIQRRMRLAATTNNVSLMKRLLEFGVSPNNHDDHGRTPLHISACRGYTEIVRLLLENGADPNQRDCIGNTPLHLATVNSKLSVVTLLLTAGTDVLALDSYGYNPLQLAKTKLRMLQRNCNNEDMLEIKEEMHNVINMLMAYLQKQKNMREQRCGVVLPSVSNARGRL